MDITPGLGDDGGEAITGGEAGGKGGGQGGGGSEDGRVGAAIGGQGRGGDQGTEDGRVGVSIGGQGRGGDQGSEGNNNAGVRMEAEFDEVITNLTTYLHILSSGSSDTDRELKDQGK